MDSFSVETLISAIQQAPLFIIGPVVGAIALAVARKYLGRWPDLWRYRRFFLPILARFEDHPAVPGKTEIGLRDVEYVGVVDAPPAAVRQWFRDEAGWWPAPFASIQYEQRDSGSKRYEVGSYAHRPGGFTGRWQTHVRLTPRDGGEKTALWAHKERSPIAAPRKHYNAVGWNAALGVRETARQFQEAPFDIELGDHADTLVADASP